MSTIEFLVDIVWKYSSNKTVCIECEKAFVANAGGGKIMLNGVLYDIPGICEGIKTVWRIQILYKNLQ